MLKKVKHFFFILTSIPLYMYAITCSYILIQCFETVYSGLVSVHLSSVYLAPAFFLNNCKRNWITFVCDIFKFEKNTFLLILNSNILNCFLPIRLIIIRHTIKIFMFIRCIKRCIIFKLKQVFHWHIKVWLMELEFNYTRHNDIKM